jgi:hypothetical protein
LGQEREREHVCVCVYRVPFSSVFKMPLWWACPSDWGIKTGVIFFPNHLMWASGNEGAHFISLTFVCSSVKWRHWIRHHLRQLDLRCTWFLSM